MSERIMNADGRSGRGRSMRGSATENHAGAVATSNGSAYRNLGDQDVIGYATSCSEVRPLISPRHLSSSCQEDLDPLDDALRWPFAKPKQDIFAAEVTQSLPAHAWPLKYLESLKEASR
jgi:hypothetical protein